MAPQNQQDIQPTGGQPTGAPDFPDQQSSVMLVQVPRYTATVPVSFPVSAIAPNQKPQTLTCEFTYLPPGVTLDGTPTFGIVEDLNGVDEAPFEAVFVGAAVIGTAPLAPGSNRSNIAALQQIKNAVSGALYVIEALCPASNGDTAEGHFLLPCRAPGELIY